MQGVLVQKMICGPLVDLTYIFCFIFHACPGAVVDRAALPYCRDLAVGGRFRLHCRDLAVGGRGMHDFHLLVNSKPISRKYDRVLGRYFGCEL